jgi:hypothetical protein
MMLPEQPTSCSSWNATGPFLAKGSKQPLCSIPPSAEACAVRFPNAKRGMVNAIGEISKLSLDHL